MRPVLFSFVKQPAERFSIGVDWQPRLAAGETLDAVHAAAQRRDGTPAPEVIDDYGTVGAVSYVTVRNGTDGQVYKISLRVTTSLGNVYEADLTMTVREF